MELYKILFIIGAVLVIIGLVPACIDAIKTFKDVFLCNFKDDKSFLFEVIMFTIAIVCFVIGIIIMFIMKIYNG
uniref:Poxvirus virion envelope protein A14 n=1 Tax=Myoviridae sp. ctJ2i1 TaxID=2825079 RepID=A0A8S5V1P6_9CAUD|nr:MAG TPA: Poxvirus virion envelope protein A14 [Myoviridae sp. ctJ2i1]